MTWETIKINVPRVNICPLANVLLKPVVQFTQRESKFLHFFQQIIYCKKSYIYCIYFVKLFLNRRIEHIQKNAQVIGAQHTKLSNTDLCNHCPGQQQGHRQPTPPQEGPWSPFSITLCSLITKNSHYLGC